MTTDGDPLGWLREHAAGRESAGLRRVLRPRQIEEPLLDLAGNDYLGLARHPLVVEAGVTALRGWGAGATSSRLVVGSTQLHAAFEQELADFVGAPAALVFSSGYLANLGAVTSLVGDGDFIVSDALCHASLVDACRLTRAHVVVTPHADVAAVDAALSSGGWRRALVLTDSVFSADGDLAPLADLHGVVRRHGAVLLVDDAHALGVVGDEGRGAAHAAGLAAAPDVVVTTTMSKSLGSQGGAVLGSVALVEHLVDTARTFIFDTGLAPSCVATAQMALRLIARDPELPRRARSHAKSLSAIARDAGLRTTPPAAAIVSVLIGEPEAAVEAAAVMARNGVRVGCFRPPSVPAGTSRLRLTARADLTDDELLRAAIGLREVASTLNG
jgi:8-amino-7-oxononanoate synthase